MPKDKSLEGMLKSGILKRGNSPALVLERTPIGIAQLDEMLGGGLPIGRCIEAYGPESTGKTLIAQYMAAAFQRTEKPQVLLFDLEHCFDATWWRMSGVDTDKLLVSSPATGEQVIDIMVQMVEASDELGLIIVDSIPAMIPSPVADTEKSAEDNKQPGLVAKLVSLMYYKMNGPIAEKGITLLVTNQMRANIGGYDELAALPGGKAQRHFNQIIIRTHREGWIKEDGKNIGFFMNIISKKNKTCSVPDGTSITLPFLAAGAFDIMSAQMQDAIEKKIIVKSGPYYKWAGQNHLGMPALRQFFVDNPEELEMLTQAVEAA